MTDTRDAESVPADVAAWCVEHVGSRAVRRFFVARSMSHVHGVELADGRRVAIKVRGAQSRLAACATVQAAVRAAGIATPELIAGPEPFPVDPSPAAAAGAGGATTADPADPGGLDRSMASAEEWLDGGLRLPPIPPRDLGERFARLHARIMPVATAAVDARAVAPPPPWLDCDHDAADRVWPPAPAARWDPHRIDDELPDVLRRTACAARARLLADDVRALPVVVGHGDLNGVNTRWYPDDADGGGWRVVVHDWDSVAARPEAVLVGMCATDFLCTDVNVAVPVDVGHVVLDAYAVARGRPWTTVEREAAWATSAWLAAYTAVFEHLHGAPGDFTATLTHDASERLRLAGC